MPPKRPEWTVWALHQSTCLLDVGMLLTFVSPSLPNDSVHQGEKGVYTHHSDQDRQYGPPFHELLSAEPLQQHTSPESSLSYHKDHEYNRSSSHAAYYRYPVQAQFASETSSGDPNTILGSPGLMAVHSIKQEQIETKNNTGRVWHRAPNGQFASVAQLANGSQSHAKYKDNTGPNGERVIRKRRKSEEIDRKYRCDFFSCKKAYGTLNRKSASSSI